MREIKKDFFKKDAVHVAKALLGKLIKFKKCSGIIVETEAYKDDPASHAHKPTPRSMPLIEKYGTVYVYLNYGTYHLLNFTCDEKGPGGVLIRAVEPIDGISIMKRRRKTKDIYNLCSGPGKLCQAFGINMEQHNKEVGEEIHVYDIGKKVEIEKSARIGISKGVEYEWRFFVKGSPFVSKQYKRKSSNERYGNKKN
ncbi:MAG: DNA-3-methyladenine glycosylase [Nanoarchaeota archaeon]|nr:DNA-3-methyladenine glycosylase [Nanoarchaeota archaeon]